MFTMHDLSMEVVNLNSLIREASYKNLHHLVIVIIHIILLTQ